MKRKIWTEINAVQAALKMQKFTPNKHVWNVHVQPFWHAKESSYMEVLGEAVAGNGKSRGVNMLEETSKQKF